MQLIVRRVATPAPLSVLFVSEDADLRAVAGRVLSGAGFETTTAAHGGHAILACLTKVFDVLVLDQELADGSADALVRTLRDYRPELAVVRMCGCEPDGSDGFLLVGPFTADDLIEAIRSSVTLISSAF